MKFQKDMCHNLNVCVQTKRKKETEKEEKKSKGA